jgi:hypothetical protein
MAMTITNPEPYAQLSPQLLDLLRQSVLLRLVDDEPQSGLGSYEVANQCLTDIMALGFNDTREEAHFDLGEEMEQNPLVEEVDYDALWERIVFSADAFPDEIRIFKNFILAVNRSEAESALTPAQNRVTYLKAVKGR